MRLSPVSPGFGPFRAAWVHARRADKAQIACERDDLSAKSRKRSAPVGGAADDDELDGRRRQSGAQGNRVAALARALHETQIVVRGDAVAFNRIPRSPGEMRDAQLVARVSIVGDVAALQQ